MPSDISENLETVCVQAYKFQTDLLQAKDKKCWIWKLLLYLPDLEVFVDLAVLPDVYFTIIVYQPDR